MQDVQTVEDARLAQRMPLSMVARAFFGRLEGETWHGRSLLEIFGSVGRVVNINKETGNACDAYRLDVSKERKKNQTIRSIDKGRWRYH